MKASDLRGILTYVPSFRDKIFVIAIDGEIVESENFVNLLLDIAVLRSLNIKIVIVHGASHQIRQIAAEGQIAISNDDGTGITDEATLKIALMAANRLTHEIMEGLTSSDLRSAYANCIEAHPFGIIGGVDHLYTGKVEKVDTEFLQTFLNNSVIPVVPPLGFDGDGKTYRVNSDGVAVRIAETLKAAKLIFITNHEGIPRDGGILRQISVNEAEECLRKSRQLLPPPLVSKVTHAVRACQHGVPRVHIINGRNDEALMNELFSSEGVGTMIYSNEYTAIRRAMKKDVSNLLKFIRESVQNEELIKRNRAEVVAQIQDYFIFEIDRNLVGCVALHMHSDQECGELACLYVAPSHENQGIGRKLVQFVENQAREKGVKKLIALSSQAFMWFQQKGGFQLGSPDDLPPARREKYDQSRRNSKILVKHLNGESKAS